LAKKTTKKAEIGRNARIRAIQRQIASLDVVGSGTLLKRMKLCGKPNCRCATDPSTRHGPYYEWNRFVDGKLRHTVVKPDEVTQVRRALDNYQRALELLAHWETESMRIILGPENVRLGTKRR